MTMTPSTRWFVGAACALALIGGSTLAQETTAITDESPSTALQLELLKRATADAIEERTAAEAELQLIRQTTTTEIEELKAARAESDLQMRTLSTELDDTKAAMTQLSAELAALRQDGGAAGTADAGSGDVQSAAFTPVPDAAAENGIDSDRVRVGLVHFDPGSAALTPGGQRLTAEAAERIRSMEIAKVRVVGYTDTTGGADFNKHLSLQRADSIAEMLADAGISRDMIEIVGSGEDGVPEPTGDHVSEPLNRCAGIFVVGALQQ